MGNEINLLATHPAVNRDYDKRLQEKTPEIISIAKEFGKEFFENMVVRPMDVSFHK